MKTQLIFALLMSGMSIAGSIHGQQLARLSSSHKISQAEMSIKAAPDAKAAKASVKAVAYLERVYPNIKNPDWRNHSEGKYIIFVQNRQHFTVSFNKKGSWIQTIRKYYPDDLSDEIKLKVADNYPEYEIYYVNEITSPKIDTPVYILQMKANKMYINLLVTNNDMKIGRAHV